MDEPIIHQTGYLIWAVKKFSFDTDLGKFFFLGHYLDFVFILKSYANIVIFKSLFLKLLNLGLIFTLLPNFCR